MWSGRGWRSPHFFGYWNSHDTSGVAGVRRLIRAWALHCSLCANRIDERGKEHTTRQALHHKNPPAGLKETWMWEPQQRQTTRERQVAVKHHQGTKLCVLQKNQNINLLKRPIGQLDTGKANIPLGLLAGWASTDPIEALKTDALARVREPNPVFLALSRYATMERRDRDG